MRITTHLGSIRGMIWFVSLYAGVSGVHRTTYCCFQVIVLTAKPIDTDTGTMIDQWDDIIQELRDALPNDHVVTYSGGLKVDDYSASELFRRAKMLVAPSGVVEDLLMAMFSSEGIPLIEVASSHSAKVGLSLKHAFKGFTLLRIGSIPLPTGGLRFHTECWAWSRLACSFSFHFSPFGGEGCGQGSPASQQH